MPPAIRELTNIVTILYQESFSDLKIRSKDYKKVRKRQVRLYVWFWPDPKWPVHIIPPPPPPPTPTIVSFQVRPSSQKKNSHFTNPFLAFITTISLPIFRQIEQENDITTLNFNNLQRQLIPSHQKQTLRAFCFARHFSICLISATGPNILFININKFIDKN